MIQLECFNPSSGPIGTSVDNLSPLVKTGAHVTVENWVPEGLVIGLEYAMRQDSCELFPDDRSHAGS